MKFAPAAQRLGFLPAGGGRLVTPLIAVMSFLTALSLAGALMLSGASADLGDALGRDATVQIVEANPDVANAQVDTVLRLLDGDRSVSHVRLVSRAEAERLLEPWLGVGTGSGDLLPIPPMIDLRLRPGADTAALAHRLRAAAPAARLDIQAHWLKPLQRMLGALSGLAIAVVAAVSLATAAVVVLGTRAALGGHAPTIDLLHVMGADDADIARVFQHRYLLHGLIGGAAGVACAVLVMAVLAANAASLGLGSPPAAAWLLLAAVPVAVAALAALAARLSVARALADRL